MLYSNRLIFMAFMLCLTSFTLQDCGRKNQPAGTNRNTRNSNASTDSLLQQRASTAAEMYYGVTIEDTDTPDSIVATLKRIKQETRGKKVAVRVVIDPERDVNDEEYKERLRTLKQESDMVVALIGDSHDVHKFKDVKAYKKRVNESYRELSQWVDVWEIGNEVNGVWAGWEAKEGARDEDQPWNQRGADRKGKRNLIGKQIKGAYDELLRLNKEVKMALTLYYSGDWEECNLCWDGPEYVMSRWIEDHIKDKGMREGLKYVLVSFYSDDCPVISDDTAEGASQWAAIFNSLSATFKNADVGFGEFGPQCSRYEECKINKNRLCPDCVNDQIKFIPKYYRDYDKRLKESVQKYMGGYFYWYGLQDMIPSDRTAVNELIKALKEP